MRNYHDHDVPHANPVVTTTRALVRLHHQQELQHHASFFPTDDQYYYYYDHSYPPEEFKFIGIIPWTLRLIKLSVIGTLLLVSSATCYGVLYWVVMPGRHASRPLFFDYTGTVPYPHVNVTKTVASPNQPQQEQEQEQPEQTCNHPLSTISNNPLDPPASCSTTSTLTSYYSPWATVDLFMREQAVTLGMETLHPETMPPPQTQQRILPPGQAYFVEVVLTLPETLVNQQVGMFGVAVDLLSSSSSPPANLLPNVDSTSNSLLQLASSVRPARLPHESPWVAMVRKTFWILPLIFGAMSESRDIVIPSFRHIVESKNYPLRHVVVRLVRQPPTSATYMTRQQASSPTSGMEPTVMDMSPPLSSTVPIVEVIRGEVRIGKELNAWQEVMKEWFYTCYLLGTFLFFSLHLATLGILRYYYWDQPQENVQYHYGDQQPYFDDPSFVFDGDQQGDGFESLNDDNEPRSYHEQDETFVDGSSFIDGNNRAGNDNNFATSDNADDWEECPPTVSGAQQGDMGPANMNPERSSNSTARRGVGRRYHREQPEGSNIHNVSSPRDRGSAWHPSFVARANHHPCSFPQVRTEAKEKRKYGKGLRKNSPYQASSVPPCKGLVGKMPSSTSANDTRGEIFFDCMEGEDPHDDVANLPTIPKSVIVVKSEEYSTTHATLSTNGVNVSNSCLNAVPPKPTYKTSLADGPGSTKGYSKSRLLAESQCTVNLSPVQNTAPFHEECLRDVVLKLPEAQVLDSFLADLIQPFVQ